MNLKNVIVRICILNLLIWLWYGFITEQKSIACMEYSATEVYASSITLLSQERYNESHERFSETPDSQMDQILESGVRIKLVRESLEELRNNIVEQLYDIACIRIVTITASCIVTIALIALNIPRSPQRSMSFQIAKDLQ